MTIQRLFFELIRVAIGTQDSLSEVPSAKEWKLLYDMAKKQSLVGICFAGVQRLGYASYENENRLEPSENLQSYWNLPELQYLTWMGMAAKIQQRNEVVNRQCVELCHELGKDGFRTCILKGQGTASLYKVRGKSLELRDLSVLRQSGDIDVWVMPKDERTIKDSRPRITEFVHRRFPDEKGAFMHIGFPCYSDSEVEMHYIPTMDGDPLVDRRFRHLFEKRQDACFGNISELGFATPEPMVNVLFNLHHVKRHFITSGVGLRHIIDLYFVFLSMNENENLCLHESVKKLGMEKFFAGIVWVMNEVLGEDSNLSTLARPSGTLSLERTSNLKIKPDARLGQFILQEIMQGGNFGHHDERLKGVNEMGFWKRWKHFLELSLMRARYFPTDVFWSYVFRLRIGIWRKTGFEI